MKAMGLLLSALRSACRSKCEWRSRRAKYVNTGLIVARRARQIGVGDKESFGAKTKLPIVLCKPSSALKALNSWRTLSCRNMTCSKISTDLSQSAYSNASVWRNTRGEGSVLTFGLAHSLVHLKPKIKGKSTSKLRYTTSYLQIDCLASVWNPSALEQIGSVGNRAGMTSSYPDAE